jgi:hypothetical protein
MGPVRDRPEPDGAIHTSLNTVDLEKVGEDDIRFLGILEMEELGERWRKSGGGDCVGFRVGLTGCCREHRPVRYSLMLVKGSTSSEHDVGTELGRAASSSIAEERMNKMAVWERDGKSSYSKRLTYAANRQITLSRQGSTLVRNSLSCG